MVRRQMTWMFRVGTGSTTRTATTDADSVGRPSLGVAIGAVGLVVVAVGRSAIAPILPLILVFGAALSWSIGKVITRQAQARSGLSLVVWSGLVVPAPRPPSRTSGLSQQIAAARIDAPHAPARGRSR